MSAQYMAHEIMPQHSALSSPRRLGYELLDTEPLGIDADLLHHSYVELTGQHNALGFTDDTTEDFKRTTFATDPSNPINPLKNAPATNEIAERVHEFVRSLAEVEPDFASETAPHAGLADWKPSHIDVERFRLPHGNTRVLANRRFEDTSRDHFLTAMLTVRGEKILEIRPSGDVPRTQFPMLHAGKLLLVRAQGLIEGERAMPEYRTSQVGSHVALTLHNRLAASFTAP